MDSKSQTIRPHVTDEELDKSNEALKSAYSQFVAMPYGIERIKLYDESVCLYWGNDDAVNEVCVAVDSATAEFKVQVMCYSALTSTARKNICRKRFNNASAAIQYAIDTFSMINRFFNQF